VTRARDDKNEKPRTRGGGSDGWNGQRPNTGGYVISTRYTGRNRDDGRNRNDRRDRDYDRGYERGYDHGYDRGYYRGYYRGHRSSGFYLHHHHYGSHRVYGHHYGGFGFYLGHWHFVMVIGSPIVVHQRYRYYGYDWWDGRGHSLYSWNRAMEAYPANYNFDLSRATCVSLWIRTTAGEDYVLKADPRFWNARDPGDLYAILWGQLEREGYIEIQDLSGRMPPTGLARPAPWAALLDTGGTNPGRPRIPRGEARTGRIGWGLWALVCVGSMSVSGRR
jgi:hypothetical protein